MDPMTFKACIIPFNLGPSERNRGAVPRTPLIRRWQDLDRFQPVEGGKLTLFEQIVNGRHNRAIPGETVRKALPADLLRCAESRGEAATLRVLGQVQFFNPVARVAF